MYFTKEEIITPDTKDQKEWIITNGIGGFASGTLNGGNSRRYHGLLVASLNPPVARHLVVSNLHEVLEFDNTISYLSSFECTGNYSGKGYKHLEAFQNNFVPTWHYFMNDLTIKKQIFMVYGENTTIVRYKIKNGKKGANFQIYPLINFRDYHSERKEFSSFCVNNNKKFIEVKFNDDETKTLKIICNDLPFGERYDTFYSMYYKKEEERGLEAVENHFMPGDFYCKIEPFEEKDIDIILTTEERIKFDVDEEYEKVISRAVMLINKAGFDDALVNALVKASDAFIVDRKSTSGKTIIAGYPWFTDWGRDTLIAFTGLTLATKRYDDAKSILETFIKYIKGGLLPNVFPDYGETPGYNTVDASLWFFEAVYNYYKYTKDVKFLGNAYESLESIFNRYSMSREDIKKINTELIYMDVDKLICEGDEYTQLTWMDAKVGNLVVTPRNGKPVEINALWYNAAMIMDKISKKLKKHGNYSEIAKQIKESFINEFWNSEDDCLYDVINEKNKDGSIRPNQILALSLNFPVITGAKARSIFNVVARDLYTPAGLRTLSSKDKRYRAIYVGDVYNRDTAYHQGTVWAWLLGPFITASKRLEISGEYSEENIKRKLSKYLRAGAIGTLSEIFDAEPPHKSRGCVAQAWSIGTILQAITEND